MNEKTEIGAEEKCENRILQEEPEVIVHKLEYTKSLKLKEIMANDNEKLIPLFFPCYLVAIGIITLTGISLIDPALLESANWKQNTIWSALLFFGLLPPYMRSTKGVWLIMGYILAFFLFGGGNVFGTVQLILSIFKIFLPVFILFQMVRLWGEVRKYGKWVLLFPVIALIFALLLLSIEDRNIFQSTWTSLTNWSWDMYRSDDGFHIYLGCIGILAGITEFLIVRKYMEN